MKPRTALARIITIIKLSCPKHSQLHSVIAHLASATEWSKNESVNTEVPAHGSLWKWMRKEEAVKNDPLEKRQLEFLPCLEEIFHKELKWHRHLHLFPHAKAGAPDWFNEIDFKTLRKPGASQYGDLSQNESLQIGDHQLAELLLNNKVSQLEHAQERKDTGTEMECLYALASLAAELEDWNKAIQYRKSIVRLHEKNGDCFQHATGLSALARDQFSAGLYVEAIQNLKASKNFLLALQNPDLELFCETLDYMGVCIRAHSRDTQTDNEAYSLSEARECFTKSLLIREQLKSPPGIASTLHRLGHLLAQIAYLEEKNGNGPHYRDAFLDAEQRLREAMNLRMKLGLRLDYCRSVNQYVSLFLNFFDKSPPKQCPDEDIRRLLQETTRLAEESKLRKIWFQSLIASLRLERKVNNYSRAIEVFEVSYEGNDLAFKPSDFEKAKLLEQRAKIAGAMRDSTELDWWKKAADLWQTLGDEKRRYSASRNLSNANWIRMTTRKASSLNAKRTAAK